MSNAKLRAPGSARSGRVLIILIALLFVAGIAFLWLGAGERAAGRTLAPRTEEAPAQSAGPSELVAAPRAPSEAAEPTDGELAPFVPARASETRFAGKLGSLRGHIEVSGENPFPQTWRLVLRPSNTLPAREHAVSRSIEFSDARTEFEVAELPLGGYDVHGEAPGFNGQVLPVLLEPGNEHPFVNLRFVPCGTLEGRILDADSLPAEGVKVTLLAVPEESLAGTVTTDASGVYRFEQLADGEYEILVGEATAPLMPERRPVRFMAPRLTFPDIDLPQLGQLLVRVVDSLARPLEGVEVRGSGTHGGVIDGRTDYDGRLVVKHLPAGQFRLRLQHPSFAKEYAKRIAVEVEAGKVTEAPVRLGP